MRAIPHMGAYQKEWARRARANLLALLGPSCAYCGSVHGLTFDCISPKGDRHHRMDTSARMSFYRGQERAGNLQVLCLTCNSRKGESERSELGLSINKQGGRVVCS